ncbi:YybS family protein [Clostridium grantii]|uniref:Uncharacterized conserved protein YybS, DUF2232 family n=1 Tax=Clostridium grantii DSM 8605 TaxID=1121316 RepID=A0A1M5XGC5_9CLOT|nr:DUF2232 domain-containing protein [Clostridium grantii]SHH98935.1 Uncharacterized conserved protein YybS, DUF2232 family [Clostridium grantii DSM 8605]
MQKNTYNTKSIVEAGIISALIVVVFLMSAYTATLSSVGTFILPIPVTILYLRNDFRIALLATITSFILAIIMVDIPSALGGAMTFGIIGMTFGYCIKNKYSKKVTVLILSIANIIAYIFQIFILLFFVTKQSLFEQINFMSTTFNEAFEETINMYQKMGITSEQLKSMDLIKEMFSTDFIMKMIPATIILWGVGAALLNYTLTRTVLNKLKYYKLEKFKQIQHFYVTNLITAGLIILWSSGVILKYFGFDMGSYLETTMIVVIQITLMVNGFATLIYYLRVKSNRTISKPVIALLIIFMFMSSFFANMVFFIGLVESILDFRNLDPYSFRKKKIKE